jgi:thiazole synthase ThiGH ThiG subunit
VLLGLVGTNGVLMNTAIAEAKDPIMMAAALKAGVEAGRLAIRECCPGSHATYPLFTLQEGTSDER